MFKYRAKNLKGEWVKGERMGKVKFIIESDFLKTNSIMKFAIEKGAKIEDYQQTLTEAETNGVRRWLKDIKENCEKPNVDSCATCKAPFCMCGYLSDEVIQKVEA